MKPLFKCLMIIILFINSIQLINAQNLRKIDSLEKVLILFKGDTNEIRVLYQLGYELTHYDDIKAQKYFVKALEIANNINYEKKKAKIISGIGINNMNLGKNKEALANFNESLKINNEKQNSLGIANDYDNIGIVNLKLGNIQVAIDFRIKALKIYEREQNLQKIADSYMWIGNCYFKKGNYNLALKNQISALRIGEKLKNYETIVYAKLNSANIFKKQGNLDKAIEYDTLALIDLIKIGKKIDIATVYSNIANIYIDKNDHNKSLKYLFLSLKTREEVKDSSGIAVSFNSIGIAYQNLKKYDIAKDYFIKTLKIVKLSGNREIEGMALVNLGTIEHEQRNFPKAISYFNSGLKILKEIEDLESIKGCYENLSIVYESMKDSKNSLKYYKLFKITDDSLKKESMSKSTLELQEYYESEKKEEKIKELNKENIIKEERNSQQKLLFSIILISTFLISFLGFYILRKRKIDAYEKKIREVKQEAINAQIDQHFITNTMDSINDFLENNNLQKASEYLLMFSRLVRNVLENSMQKNVTLQKELEIIKSYIELVKLRFTENQLTYIIDVDEKIDVSNILIPPMVFQLLVENSLTHGLNKRTGGILKMGIKKDSDRIQAYVEDNGIGRIASTNERKDSVKSNKSIGNSLVQELIMINNSPENNDCYKIIDLYDINQKPIGTRVEFSLPISLLY